LLSRGVSYTRKTNKTGKKVTLPCAAQQVHDKVTIPVGWNIAFAARNGWRMAKHTTLCCALRGQHMAMSGICRALRRPALGSKGPIAVR
jgi:hypothetical protein